MLYNKPPGDPTSATVFSALSYVCAGLCFLIGWPTLGLSLGFLCTAAPIYFFLASVIWGFCPEKKARLLEIGLEILLAVTLGVSLLCGVLFWVNCLNLALIVIGTVGPPVWEGIKWGFSKLSTDKSMQKESEAAKILSDVNNMPVPPLTLGPSVSDSNALAQNQQGALDHNQPLENSSQKAIGSKLGR